jgi:glycosyltransferase involved in cell wall biosynthesis
MRVLLVNDYAEPVGGAEVQMLALRETLRQQGHDVRLFASSAAAGGGAPLADDYCFGTVSSFRTALQTVNLSAAWRLRQLLRDFRPDVVHVKIFLTQLSPTILPLLADVPSLYHVAWYRAICPLGTKTLPDGSPCHERWGTACYRRGCVPARDWPLLMLQMRLWWRWRSAFNVIVANSEAVRRALIAEGIDVSHVIHHGVPARPPRPPLRDPPTIAFAGRLVREKGVDVLLHALARIATELPSVRLLIAGDGPERSRLAQLAGDLGLTDAVAMAGHLPRGEVERWFDSAWVQAVPSRWAEPFGIVATEALMRGTAVVATDPGGMAEIVEHGHTGYLVPRGDVDALAAALLALLRDREHAERMGHAAREAAIRSFCEPRSASKFIELYESLRSPTR